MKPDRIRVINTHVWRPISDLGAHSDGARHETDVPAISRNSAMDGHSVADLLPSVAEAATLLRELALHAVADGDL
jgi:hypothetical protein